MGGSAASYACRWGAALRATPAVGGRCARCLPFGGGAVRPACRWGFFSRQFCNKGRARANSPGVSLSVVCTRLSGPHPQPRPGRMWYPAAESTRRASRPGVGPAARRIASPLVCSGVVHPLVQAADVLLDGRVGWPRWTTALFVCLHAPGDPTPVLGLLKATPLVCLRPKRQHRQQSRHRQAAPAWAPHTWAPKLWALAGWGSDSEPREQRCMWHQTERSQRGAD